MILYLRLPDEGNVSKSDKKSCARLHAGRILWIGLIPIACEIGVNMAINSQIVEIGLYDNALFSSSFNIPGETLDSGSVGFFRIDAEASTAVDGVGTIGTCIISKILCDANGGLIVELFAVKCRRVGVSEKRSDTRSSDSVGIVKTTCIN